ncbi:hypothetical protein [Arthrobacter sp. M4]|uniref:hypothetical protein n=1 Tax=Arthrobacter sp. M4 TaxID=218160 RepID=UPI001CDBCD20|nr:hypothetical protein [Arthrobacter sp. M4]MCA4131279.1 hypothetical protein [Arthrobacter sp. M4]
MAKSSWISHATVGLSCAAAAALGLAGVTGMQPPSTLKEPGEARTAAITVTQFKDERTVAAEVDALQPVAASLGLSGVVTSSSCVPGGELASGKVAASINGRPVLGLHTAVPLYRDIGPGAQGPDVDGLRVQLNAMGHALSKTGLYAADLRAAITKLQTDNGLQKQDGTLHVEDTLWLPGGNVRVRSCDALLGSNYAAGQPFLTTAGTLQSIRVVFPSGQPPAQGDRRVQFGEASAPMANDGLVTERAFLDVVSRSAEFAATQSSNSPKPLSVKTSLSASIEVAKLPVSGVFAVNGDSGCVKSVHHKEYRVRIVGSSLGSVLATFPSDVPKDILLGESIGASECNE